MTYKLNTPLVEIAPDLQKVEAIRRRLRISIIGWAPMLGYTREHYSTLINGHRAAPHPPALIALAEKIHRRYRELQGHSLERLAIVTELEKEFSNVS